MHLGFINGPFVPHNLIPTQESPVPLPKFQMAPRLKILMASGSKRNPDITFIVSQKSRQTNPLQVPQQGPYKERSPSTGHFAYLSKTSPFGFPSIGVFPQGPLNGIPRREIPQHYSPNLNENGSKKGTQIYFSNLPRVPANEPLPGPPTGPPLTLNRRNVICSIQGISPYRAVNTFHQSYKTQSVNDVQSKCRGGM
jgi:hypothetical protein